MGVNPGPSDPSSHSQNRYCELRVASTWLKTKSRLLSIYICADLNQSSYHRLRNLCAFERLCEVAIQRRQEDNKAQYDFSQY